MRRLADSPIALKRTAFQDLKRLTLLLAYGIEGSPWRARTGFVAPVPDEPSPSRVTVRTPRAGEVIDADVVVIGSGAGGGVAASILAAAGQARGGPGAGRDGDRGGLRRAGAGRAGGTVPGPRARGDHGPLDLDPGGVGRRRRDGRQLELVVACPRRGPGGVARGRHRRRPRRALRGDRGGDRRHQRGERPQRAEHEAGGRAGRARPAARGDPARCPRLHGLRAVRGGLPDRRQAVLAAHDARRGLRERRRDPRPVRGPPDPARGRARGGRRRHASPAARSRSARRWWPWRAARSSPLPSCSGRGSPRTPPAAACTSTRWPRSRASTTSRWRPGQACRRAS